MDEDVVKGNPLFLKTNGHIEKANATDKARVAGFVWNDTDAGEICQYIINGIVNLTDWTNIIGTLNLTSGEYYYLSTESGKMTSIPPSTGFILVVGQAQSASIFNVEVDLPIKL